MMRAHCDEATQARDPRTYRPALFDRGYNLLFAQLDYGWTSD